jgi:hypothetical protein
MGVNDARTPNGPDDPDFVGLTVFASEHPSCRSTSHCEKHPNRDFEASPLVGVKLEGETPSG